MRVLGIDFGTQRIGLAVGSTETGLARPLGVIHRTTRHALWQALLDVLKRESINLIALGYPAQEHGPESTTCRQVRNFAQSLMRRTTIPLVLVNEAYSTWEALQRLTEAGVPPAKRRHLRDTAAAVEIVESYLRACSSV